MNWVCRLSIGACALFAIGCGASPEPKATTEPAKEESLSWADEGFDPLVVASDGVPPEHLNTANAGLWKIGTVEKEGVMTGQLYGVIGSDVQLRMYLHHVIAVKPTEEGWGRIFHVYKTIDQNGNPNTVVSKRVMIIDNGPLFTHDGPLEGHPSENPEVAADSMGSSWTYSAYSLEDGHMFWTSSAYIVGVPLAIDGDKLITVRVTNIVEAYAGDPLKYLLEVRNLYSCRLLAEFDLGRVPLGGYWYPIESGTEGGISLFESYHPVKGKEWHKRYFAPGEYVIEEPDGRIDITADYSRAQIEMGGKIRVLDNLE